MELTKQELVFKGSMELGLMIQFNSGQGNFHGKFSEKVPEKLFPP
jgi:hypothetical protein